jgi:hypothetical protein
VSSPKILHGFNGTDRFALLLWALAPGMNYERGVAAGLNREYIQAAGRSDEMTMEICKYGGEQWSVDWVR